MEIDKTTLSDLSVFSSEEEFSLFSKLNLTRTSRGKEQLKKNLSTPLPTMDEITGIQQTLRLINAQHEHWPMQITNGTLLVIERYFEYSPDPIPEHPTSFTAYSYKLFHGPDFSLVKYSAGHCIDFIKGMHLIVERFLQEDSPAPLKKVLSQAQKLLDVDKFKMIYTYEKPADIPISQLLHLARFLRYQYKQDMLELLNLYARLDAWYGMASSIKNYNLEFPQFEKSDVPFIEATGLYHILLHDPVDYDVTLNRDTNFLFLTGANMAGKSTFIKSVGTAVFLAHTGMGVPAQQMRLSVFDGMLSNINVIDNIVKGESYFFNEVQRIKATINKINDGRKWLILIDELFKGTNVQDAMKCSSVVIEGLLKIRNSLFILSTHLYEIGEALQKHPNIAFNYFETTVHDDQLTFNYKLRPGISNDRLGYLILKKEGVVKLLEEL